MKTHNISNQPLSKQLRAQLENTVKVARDAAEKGAQVALAQIAVADAKSPDYLTDDLKALRRRLRAHGRALGDIKASDDTQSIQHLVWEVAYEHWHRMLFARFLAENGLLLWEPGAAVSLDDCEALVQESDRTMNLGAKTKWELAAKLAARMLPQVFKLQSPIFDLTFTPEHQRELERLLASLTPDVFQASDSLGWVYQFWQAKRKDAVNGSEAKIGADELPAVTQLFTEAYMVEFLLHNSLGAWWVTQYSGQPSPIPLTYLRTLSDGSPAAGKFEGWPDRLRDFKLLDPCCGSGHFLVAAFLMLVPMRMAADGLSAANAVDAVLADNLHGLELDARCVEIAVFALALTAWRYPDEAGNPLGVRLGMPAPQVACCGLKVAAKPEEWAALVPEHIANVEHLREGLRRLHRDFSKAPLLGSLVDPSKASGDLFAADYSLLANLLEGALQAEYQPELWEDTAGMWDNAVNARGLLDAARLLAARYHLVITNVPYLARGKQHDTLKDYCEIHYSDAKGDLANVFLERCLELALEPDGGPGAGVVQIVMPQNWLFLNTYKKQRLSLLGRVQFSLIALLGTKSFQTPMWDFNVQLLTVKKVPPEDEFRLCGIDVSLNKSALEKAAFLRDARLLTVNQKGQLKNPDARIAFDETSNLPLLSAYAEGLVGLQTSDDPMFITALWEVPSVDRSVWELMQGTPAELRADAGASWLVRWEQGKGLLLSLPTAYPTKGLKAVGKHGIAIHRMQVLFPYWYVKERFHQNVAVIVPRDERHLPAIWSFCSSPEYSEAVRHIDQALKVTNATLVKVPFDLARWEKVAAEKLPYGLPKPYSDDPTQWLFHGHPQPALDPLQVAVARLLGYRWPAETDASMELADEARLWVAHCEQLAEYTDDDGIVCLPSVRGEKPAHERVLEVLISAWETVEPGTWKPAVLDKLLHNADCKGKSLNVWLRDKFFEQHVKRFYHRPFIWHVWDGLSDGFAALVNYHKLDHKNLERLIHTYLGDWIRQQEAGVRDGVDGAAARLAAAQDLKRRLELILQGEMPYDIFVRWKPLVEQPTGWNPDLNDGVRPNIRPFVTAEVLRHNKKPKLNVTWEKDRGKDGERAPWFDVFKGERVNDHHLPLDEKQAVMAIQREKYHF